MRITPRVKEMHRVLLLGSGRTCLPLVELLTKDGFSKVTVASNDIKQAQHIAELNQNTTFTQLDVQSESDLHNLIHNHDLVISMLPYQFHSLVAQHCIAYKTNMVTSSYVSPELSSLHQSAKEAGIVIMNECGLDPGIDHMLAMDCIHEVHQENGKIVYFESWCGGLPHSRFANNPLGYKFSWNPAGVLMAVCNPARYLYNNRVIEIPRGGAVMKEAKLMPDITETTLPLEGYPNRDSLQFRDLYGIPEAHTVIRGTLRYQGYCQVMDAFNELGLLNNEPFQRLQSDSTEITWKDFIAMLISQTDIRHSDLSSCVLEALNNDQTKFQSIQNLSLLSSEPVSLRGTPLRALAAHLEKKLEFSPNEYDTVILQHKIGIEKSDCTKEEHCITLKEDGIEYGHTAMANLVGKPVAIAAKIILSGQFSEKGVLRPLSAKFYKPALQFLKEEGLKYSIKIKKI